MAGLGVLVAISGAVTLVWRRRAEAQRPSYLRVSADVEPVDPLIRSQLAASVLASPGGGQEPFHALRAWATGTAHINAELEDMHRELRTLQTYVLELDTRYMKREEAAWLSVEVCGLVITIVAGIATTIWAVLDHAA